MTSCFPKFIGLSFTNCIGDIFTVLPSNDVFYKHDVSFMSFWAVSAYQTDKTNEQNSKAILTCPSKVNLPIGYILRS